MKTSTNNVLVMAEAFVIYYFIDWLVFHFFMEWKTILFLQLILVAFTYSGYGTAVLRFIYDLQPVQTKDDRERLFPLFFEVQQFASMNHPNLRKEYGLFIDNSSCVNAYALGSDTIVLTRGAILQLSDEQIKGIMAHELGHIYNGDTFLSIFLMLGNYIFLAVIGLFRLVKIFFKMVADTLEDENLKPRMINILVGSLYVICLLGVNALLMINSRNNEYRADRFALEIGYGNHIIKALYHLSMLQIGYKPSLVERVKSSHPNIYNRIARLEKKIA